jgi:hypothetical protein
VLPHGQSAVGLSGDHNATGGNNGAKVVVDETGRAHMVWLDAGRAGIAPAVMYRRAATAGPGRDVLWETPPVVLSDAQSASGSAYVTIAASPGAVHIAWQAGGTARYRRLSRAGDGWVLEPGRDTGVKSGGKDVGPSIAAVSDTEIHLVSPSAAYGVSKDGGQSWTASTVPLLPGTAPKVTTVAVDRWGNAHVAYSAIVHGPLKPDTAKSSSGYWQLRYVRRTPDGLWEDAQNVLDGRADWAEARDGADVLADWVRLIVDRDGTLHIGWHGTAVSRIYGNDQAYYARRAPAAPGRWQPLWGAPQALHRLDPGAGEKFSFAPSLAAEGNRSVAVTFYDVYDGETWLGFDSAALLAEDGIVAPPRIPLLETARMARTGGPREGILRTWFPAAAPTLQHTPDGDVWLDVLTACELASGTPEMPDLIVYQRVDLSRATRQRAWWETFWASR